MCSDRNLSPNRPHFRPIPPVILPSTKYGMGHIMAAVLSILGGIAGFLAALIAVTIFSAPLLSALAVWAGTGCAVVILGLSRALIPAPRPDAHAAQELA